MSSLIEVQQEYIDTLNAGIARWSKGGHYSRIARGASHRAEKNLRKLGFTDPSQIHRLIKDAHEMAALLRGAEE